jgi:GDP-D-mannose dehydratase
MKRKIIITGALGQDGIILSKLLTKNKKFIVFGLIKKIYKNKIKKVIYKKINLLNKKEVNIILLKIRPDVIVHFGSENPSYQQKKNFYLKNYSSLKNLFNATALLKNKVHFIFPNSSHIFSNKKKKISEKQMFFLNYDYSKSNFSYSRFRINSFNYIKKFIKNKKINNIKFTNLILFNHDSKYRNNKFLLPRLIKAIKSEDSRFVNYIYKKNIIGDFSHAEDICKAIYLLIYKKVFIENLILSSNKITKVNLIIDYLLTKFQNNIQINPNFNVNSKCVIGDNTLAKKILNWKIKKNIFLAASEIYKN